MWAFDEIVFCSVFSREKNLFLLSSVQTLNLSSLWYVLEGFFFNFIWIPVNSRDL